MYEKKVWGKYMCWGSRLGLERNDGPDKAYDVNATRSKYAREKEKITIF